MGLLNGKKRRKRHVENLPPFDRIVHDVVETAVWISQRDGRKTFTVNRVVANYGQRRLFRTFSPEDIRPLLRLLRDTALWFAADHAISRELRAELQTLAEAIDAADLVTTESVIQAKRN